jgi:hypothetical protein
LAATIRAESLRSADLPFQVVAAEPNPVSFKDTIPEVDKIIFLIVSRLATSQFYRTTLPLPD